MSWEGRKIMGGIRAGMGERRHLKNLGEGGGDIIKKPLGEVEERKGPLNKS